MSDIVITIVACSGFLGIFWWAWFLGATMGFAPDKSHLTVLDIIMMIVFLPTTAIVLAAVLIMVLFYYLKKILLFTVTKW